MKYSICIRHHRKLAKRYMYSHHHICSKVRKKWPKLDSSYECVLCISCYIGNNFIVHIEIVCCTVKNRCLIFCFCLSVGLLVFWGCVAVNYYAGNAKAVRSPVYHSPSPPVSSNQNLSAVEFMCVFCFCCYRILLELRHIARAFRYWPSHISSHVQQCEPLCHTSDSEPRVHTQHTSVYR